MTVTCDECGKEYKSIKWLNKHLKKFHGGCSPQMQPNSLLSAKATTFFPQATPFDVQSPTHFSQATPDKTTATVNSNISDDMTAFKMHVTEVINSLASSFNSKFEKLENTIQVNSKLIERQSESQPNGIPANRNPSQSESNPNPASWADSIPCDEDGWQKVERKRAIPTKATNNDNLQIPLSNKFSILCQENRENRAPQKPNNEHTNEKQHTTQQNNSTKNAKKSVKFYPNQYPENDNGYQIRPKQPPPPKKPLIAVIGDSMLKGITGFQMREILREKLDMNTDKYNIVVKPFLGAHTQTMPLYIDAVLSELSQKPELIILHTGTNDVSSGKSTQEIKPFFRNTIKHITNLGIKTVISLIINRADHWAPNVTPVNHELISLCNEMEICYSGNENIGTDHLNASRYHLNRNGSTSLAENFADTIIYLYEKSRYMTEE